VVTFLHQPGGDDVLAGQFAQLEVLAVAPWLWVKDDTIPAVAALGGYGPRAVLEGDPGTGGYFQSLQFAHVH